MSRRQIVLLAAVAVLLTVGAVSAYLVITGLENLE